MKKTVKAGFVIGIDGGASKTGALIASIDGSVAKSLRAPGSAIIGQPSPEAINVLASIVRDLLAEAGADLDGVHGVVIGLSGVDFPDEYDGQFAAIASGIGIDPARLTLVNDSVIALAGSTQSPRATIVQHGTEVTLACRAALGAERVFDSHGVADCFDIRRKAVPLIARMIDGRAPATPFLDAALAHFGVAPEQFSAFVLRERAAQQAMLTLAPVIAAHWLAGDEAASFLVERAIEDYVVATKAMAGTIGPGAFTACFGGGTMRASGQAMHRAIAERLSQSCPQASFAMAEHPPEIGAAFIALHKIGVAPDALLRRVKAGARVAQEA